MGKKKKRNLPRKKLVKFLLAFVILLGVLLVVLIFFKYGVFERIEDSRAGPVKYELNGECYVIMDNIFYTIKNSDDCKKACRNECWVRNTEYYDHQFRELEGTCNYCDCYCK